MPELVIPIRMSC